MKILEIALVLVASAWGAPKDNDQHANWNVFKGQFKKKYITDEQTKSRNFQLNKQLVDQQNQKYASGQSTFQSGLNEFHDGSWADFSAKHKGYKSSQKPQSSSAPTCVAPSNFMTLASHVNWTAHGAVTPVKHQLECASDWAFSTTGTIEGRIFINTGKLIKLSEQNLLDCDTTDYGCGGGIMQNALLYIAKNKGIDTDAVYPYKAVKGTCAFNRITNATTVLGYVQLPYGNEAALQQAVATVGPISVAIDVNHASFFGYQSGIWHEPTCSSTNLDHAVLLVGYGTLNKQAYWLLKNSWGTTWGMSGYFMMPRNQNNKCGIASDALYPYM